MFLIGVKNYILIDDWKNCVDIQKYLDNHGISNYINTSNLGDKFYSNYDTVKTISNIIKYLIIIISIIILIIYYKNIIKNQEKDFQMLKTYGYNKKKLKIIVFVQLLIITFIGMICGYILYKILFWIICNYVIKIESNININNIWIINIMLAIIAIFASISTMKINEN